MNARTILLSFLLSLLPANLHAVITATDLGFVTVECDQNTEENVGGYIIYYGTESKTYGKHKTVGKLCQATLNGLTPGTKYYMAATAYTNDGLEESDFSEEITYTVPAIQSTVTSKAPSKITALETSVTKDYGDKKGYQYYQFTFKGTPGTKYVIQKLTGAPTVNAWVNTETFNVRPRESDTGAQTIYYSYAFPQTTDTSLVSFIETFDTYSACDYRVLSTSESKNSFFRVKTVRE